ncbi:hypothetical protein D3C78_1853640 [compost metagenome]
MWRMAADRITCGLAAITASSVTTGAVTGSRAKMLMPPHSAMASLTMCWPLRVYSGLSHTW